MFDVLLLADGTYLTNFQAIQEQDDKLDDLSESASIEATRLVLQTAVECWKRSHRGGPHTRSSSKFAVACTGTLITINSRLVDQASGVKP